VLAVIVLAQEEAAPLTGWELAVAAGVIVFVTVITLVTLFVFFKRIQGSKLLERTIDRWIEELRPLPDSVAAVVDEVATRRFEFLTFYGQFALTALVVALVSLMLVAGAVTAEAGLPVLATILGLILGKTVLSRRALPERPPEAEGPGVPRAGTYPAASEGGDGGSPYGGFDPDGGPGVDEELIEAEGAANGGGLEVEGESEEDLEATR
jgi:hypothetical protein